jgi:hypothetical protein
MIFQPHLTLFCLHIVAYGPVAIGGLCKQRSLLGNGSVNTLRRQRTRKQHWSYFRKRGIYCVLRAAAVSGQPLGKHDPAATDTNATME